MSTSTIASTPVDATTHRQIERLIYQFYQLLDAQNYDELSALFAADGIWHRNGEELRGPKDVREAMAQRPASFTTRHLITNVIIDAAGTDGAVASYYMTVFVHEGQERPRGPVPMEVPLHCSVYRQKFVRSGPGWLVHMLSGVPTFWRQSA